MRIITFTALILAAGIGGAAAQTGLTAGQGWVVQQQRMALTDYRLSAMAGQMVLSREARAGRAGRPQRQLR